MPAPRCGVPLCARWLAGSLVAASLAGCGGNDIQVYRVAKEGSGDPPPPPAAEQAQNTSADPVLQWKLPAGWKEVPPGQMRVASFQVQGINGQQADISVVPLPGLAGSDLDNVNRWRGQVGQPAINSEELAKAAASVEIAGQPASLFDQAGALPDSGAKARILAAVLRREGVAWFFKMTGADALVAEQKPAFVEFLKSIQFAASPVSSQSPPSHPPLTDSTTPPAGDVAKPAWQVPANWQEVPAGAFLVAKFQITGDADTQAAVNVSMSAGDGGGPLANINRWRGQLGLAPFGEGELLKQVRSLDVAGGKAMFIDMSGTDARTQQKASLLGAIVPQNGRTWFFKLMGNQQVVARETAAFTSFVQTTKLPNAQ